MSEWGPGHQDWHRRAAGTPEHLQSCHVRPKLCLVAHGHIMQLLAGRSPCLEAAPFARCDAHASARQRHVPVAPSPGHTDSYCLPSAQLATSPASSPAGSPCAGEVPKKALGEVPKKAFAAVRSELHICHIREGRAIETSYAAPESLSRMNARYHANRAEQRAQGGQTARCR